MPHYHWEEFLTHAFHVMPSMGPFVCREFTWLAKLALEKQTSQSSLVMALCIMCSVRV